MARGWSTQEKARGEIARLTGWTIPQSVYAEWESGRRTPTEANLERLRGFYGDGPEGTVAPADLVAAISVLVEEIRAERAARVAWEQGCEATPSSMLAKMLGGDGIYGHCATSPFRCP